MSIASELTALSTNISNAYNAVDSKGGTVPANKNTANLATAINSISGGGGSVEVVNGIIANFKATSSTIDANTFVEFVNTITKGTDTRLSTVSSSYQYASAVLVDTNKVFIAHRNGSYLYGMVCEISGTTITAGTDTQLSTESNSYQYASAVLVDTNKVFIAHYGSSGTLYGIVCTISGTTITAGTDTQLSTESASYQYASAVLVDTDKVFVAHRSSSNYLNGVVCAISGTTITAGTDTLLSSGTNTYYYASAVKLDTNKVFIAHGNGSYLYGVVGNATDFTARAATNRIQGLTKTACTTSTAGEVWVLDA